MENGGKKCEFKTLVLGAALAVLIAGAGIWGLSRRGGETVEVDQMGGRVTLGRSLKVISTDPPCPAVLKVGERFYIRFRYRLGTSESAQIWVRPYTRGSVTAGYGAHGSGFYHKKDREAGEAEGWFTFAKPTFVDEVCVYMKDYETGERVYTVFYKVDVRWIGPDLSKKGQAYQKKRTCQVTQSCQRSCSVAGRTRRISIDVNNPDGEAGWEDEYIVELKPVDDIRRQFGVDWFRPHRIESVSTEKPDFVNTVPKFRHDMQRYLVLRLGDAEDNQIVSVMDFDKPDIKYFPFNLYLDRDRDGDLAEDFIQDKKYISGIGIPYSDGTTESYSLHLYSYSPEPVRVAYQVHTGRHGIFEADKKRIQVLVIDNSGNGIFNDDDDVILLDWDLDGKIDGSHQADDDRPLYSVLELPGGKYRVVEFDAPGRRIVLQRQKQGWFKLR